MMQRKTVIKIQNLHNAFTEKVTFNHFNYEHFRQMMGKDNYPTWGTLKRHELIECIGQEVLFEEDYPDEFVVVNKYRVKF